MNEDILKIYENLCTMLNVVITPEQQDAIFDSTCREFFSYVKPLIIISNEEIEALETQGVVIKAGFVDDEEILGLGIGKFSIYAVDRFDDYTYIRVQPTNYNSFKMDSTYAGSFQHVAEHFFKKVEKDNYGMLESGGINMQEHIETEDINQIRDYLRKEYGVATGKTIL